ncbi:hypothetical protein, partial [Frankia sp. AgB32]|uniref:hypothetical protein n=1 Tax=Frankia sp. AgB32 TaxID=631119 RepID=UPI00200BAC69
RYAGVPRSRTADSGEQAAWAREGRVGDSQDVGGWPVGDPAEQAWSARRDDASAHAGYGNAPVGHGPPAFYDQVTDRPSDSRWPSDSDRPGDSGWPDDSGSAEDAWVEPDSDSDGIWVDEGYARPPAGHDAPRWQSAGPTHTGWDAQGNGWAAAGGSLTGPSRLPADPDYLDEAYPGELVHEAGWGHEAQSGPAEYPRRAAPYPPAGGVGRNWTERG